MADHDEKQILSNIGSSYEYGFSDPDRSSFKTRKGLDEEVVRQISAMKEEPEWMLEFRLKAYRHYLERPMPGWGPDLSDLNLDEIYYYVRPEEIDQKSWDDVPDDIKNTFERLGIPEAVQRYLVGVVAQYDSVMVYHNINEQLEKQCVIF